MQKHIGGPIEIKIMFLLLKKEIQTDSKSIYSDAMKARVCCHPDPIAQYGEVIA